MSFIGFERNTFKRGGRAANQKNKHMNTLVIHLILAIISLIVVLWELGLRH
jgi:hypothetical protein